MNKRESITRYVDKLMPISVVVAILAGFVVPFAFGWLKDMPGDFVERTLYGTVAIIGTMLISYALLLALGTFGYIVWYYAYGRR